MRTNYRVIVPAQHFQLALNHRWQRIFRGCINLSVPGRASVSDNAKQPVAKANLRSWPQIEDYAIIGDCRSAALVSREGSIEWLCWPRFDSASIFAALLDRERGGYWRIAPVGPTTFQRHYVRDSNVLETRFTGHSGSAVLTDAMTNPYAGFHDEFLPDHEVIRMWNALPAKSIWRLTFRPGQLRQNKSPNSPTGQTRPVLYRWQRHLLAASVL